MIRITILRGEMLVSLVDFAPGDRDAWAWAMLADYFTDACYTWKVSVM